MVGVGQPAVRQLAQGAHQGRLPGGAREGVEVSRTGPQLVPVLLRRRQLADGAGGRPDAAVAATRVPEPRLADRYPSVASWA